MKMKKNNQTLRIQNEEIHFHISEPSFITMYRIKNNKKPSTTQEARSVIILEIHVFLCYKVLSCDRSYV